MAFRIIGGTPKSGPSICNTCKYAKILHGQNCEEWIVCEGGMFPTGGVYSGPVRFRVSDCTKFHPSNMPWLTEMYDMAWTIEARKRGSVGFEPDRCEMEIIVEPPKKKDDSGPIFRGTGTSRS